MNVSLSDEVVSTGIEALDVVLGGGLPRGHLYLVDGAPGTGKTLLSVQFLRAGVEAGETTLFISLSQTEASLRNSVEATGLSLEGIEVHAALPGSMTDAEAEEQVIFSTASVELREAMDKITEVVTRVRPERVVYDGVGYLRMLAGSVLQYRRQLLALRDFFDERSITVLLTNDHSMGKIGNGGGELESLAHGVIELSQEPTVYGNEHRELRVVKLRGRTYHSGTHNFRIREGGLQVFPRLKAPEAYHEGPYEMSSSGIAELDELLGGGLALGSSSLFVGPSGTGKTSVCTAFAVTAAEAGQQAAIYLFDELPRTFVQRSEALGMPVQEHLDAGTIKLSHIPTGDMSPGEFADLVRRDAKDRGTSVVVIDTLTGYKSAMRAGEVLISQMHDLLSYLSSQGVLTLLVVAQHGVLADIRDPVDVSYLADAVVLLRHFEAPQGVIRQVISVFKKRYGDHEKVIRQLIIEPGAIRVGPPLENFTGVLTGVPTFEGDPDDIVSSDD